MKYSFKNNELKSNIDYIIYSLFTYRYLLYCTIYFHIYITTLIKYFYEIWHTSNKNSIEIYVGYV